MGATYKRTDLHNKCGSCLYSTQHPHSPGSVICSNRPDFKPGTQTVLTRATKCCRNYVFDPSKLCRCGETREPWYNYCPNCGLRIKMEGTNNAQG